MSADKKTVVTVQGMPGFWEVLEDHGERVVVVRGPMRLELPKSKIKSAGQAEKPIAIKPRLDVFEKDVADTLDLHGQTVEQALKHLETYLDDAKAVGHTQIHVIHGHGTGTLEKAVCRWLKAKGYRFEGGHLSRRGFISQRVFLTP